MAINHPIPVSLFDKLNQLETSFYLTGSRFFGTNHKNSDYDYFTEYTEEIIQILGSIGFQMESTSNYRDTNTIMVMRGHNWCGGQIDIQLVNDVSLKDKIQKRFKELGINKPTQEEWNLAFLLMAEKAA
jgi:hypothetical protein